ncbi:ester cyclase [Chryseobacterium oranimense]|uniref:ester cyclase n=1 Tax=Chryseobacterium oranimense TaxID=421058 RepID=UPI0021B020F3|nr:ester cyclase [Chryseobacterium oranimense]UWX60023.1 ester cyclase [Chryseobacterium oranimense]
MNNTKNKEAIRLLYDSIFNTKNFEKLPVLISDNYTNSIGEKGITAFQKPITELANAFPDAQWKVEDIITENNKVIVKQTFTGTHKLPFQNINPTYKTISVKGIATYLFKNGKIVFSEIETDRFSFLQQLGALPNLPEQPGNSNIIFLIDQFFIPKSSIAEFKERMAYNRVFIKSLSGFISDKVLENRDDSENLIVITVTEWQNQDKLNEAKIAVQAEYKRIGFNPKDFYEKLNIKMERGQYQPFQE